MDAFLGMDIGTTAAKIGLFSSDGKVLALCRHGYQTSYSASGYAEQEVSDWWQAVQKGIVQCIEESGIGPQEIRGIGVDSMTPCLIPTDRTGKVLSKVQIWSDRRATAEVEWLISSGIDEIIFSKCGNKVKLGYLLPKILWLRNKSRRVYDDTYKFLQPNGYVNYRLTGLFSMDISHGELSLLVNKSTGDWDQQLCEKIGIDIAKLPKIEECSKVIGQVSKTAAQETGLAEGTPVIAGGNDTAVASYAMNVCDCGQAILDVGSASNIAVCIDKPVSCDVCDLYHHVVSRRWITQVYSATAGAALEWFKNELFEKGNDASFEHLDSRASLAKPGCNRILFLPFLNGANDAPQARGAFLGLTTATNNNDMTRAVLEGCAYAVRKNIEFLEKATELRLEKFFLGGGASKSNLWSQIFADVTNREMIVQRIPDAAALGSAMLAADSVGMRRTSSVSQSSCGEVYTPDPANRKLYDEMYEAFLKAYTSGNITK
jgi:xylulokinase